MQNAGLDESQARIKIARKNINRLRYADDTTLMAESEEELETLDEGERGEWKNWLKTQHSTIEDHGIQSYHLMANRWVKMETVTDYFLRLQNICGWWDCSHEIKRHLLLGRKAMKILDSALKNRDIILPTKVCIVKAMVFPVIICGYKN